MYKGHIDAIRERCDAATHGPWHYFYKSKYDEHHVSIPPGADYPVSLASAKGFRLPLFPDGCPTGKGDAEFVAHARQDVPALLEYVTELEKRISVLTQAFKRHGDICKTCSYYDGYRHHNIVCRANCNDDYSWYEFDAARFEGEAEKA